MMIPDISTVSLMIGINVLIFGLCMLFYHMGQKTYAGFNDWTIGINLFGPAFTLIGFRNLLPEFFSVIVANAMICLAFILFYRGFRRFAGNRFLWRNHMGLFVVVSWILFPFFTYIRPDVNNRITVISLSGAFYFSCCAKELITGIRRHLSRFNRLFFMVLVFFALFLAARGLVFQLPGFRIDAYLSGGAFHRISLIFTNVILLFYFVGLIQLNAQMLEKDLDDENKRLAESEKRYRSLVENSPLGVIILKAEPLKVCFANQSMIDITGYSSHDFNVFSPQKLLDIIHPEDREMVLANLRERLKGTLQPAKYQARLIDTSGNILWTEVYARVIRYEEEAAVQAIIVDITGKKRAFDQTVQLNLLNEKLIASGSLDDKLRRITDFVVSVFRADFSRIWIVRAGDRCGSDCMNKSILLDSDATGCPEHCLHLAASAGRYTHIDGTHDRIPLGTFRVGKVAAGIKPSFLTNDVAHDPDIHDKEWTQRYGLQSFAGYRLLSSEGSVIGVLALFSRHKILSEEDAMLGNLASTTAQVIQAVRIEDDLKKSEKWFRALFEQAAVGMSLCNSNTGRYIRVNRKYCDIVGYSEDELVFRTFLNLTHPDDLKADLDCMEQMKNGTIPNFSMEKRYLHKNGSSIWVRLTVSPMWAAGEPPNFHIAVVENIMEQKQADNRIKASLKEKEVLLQEIHHRVKNNMQVVSSLISLQANTISDKRLIEQFADTQARVQSMALIHDILYQSRDFSRISLQAYLEPLAEHLLDMYSRSDKRITVDIKTHQIHLKMDHAVPCGLIVVELISNAIKYAMPPRTGLIIAIRAEYVSDRHIEMSVRDNGDGMVEDFDVANPETLGLKIVSEIISGQLEGTWQVNVSQGVSWTITWPV